MVTLNDKIVVRGAREHNLKNINVELPRNKFIVITGLSGSGKSSLAFDTIYAEGQRRYVESLSAYARQFLSLMEKPDVDYIEGLSPAISIEQKAASRNPRSTVERLQKSMITFACCTRESALPTVGNVVILSRDRRYSRSLMQLWNFRKILISGFWLLLSEEGKGSLRKCSRKFSGKDFCG